MQEIMSDREPKEGEYFIPTSIDGFVVGQIACSKPGLRLVDFYRTSTVLAKDVPPLPPLPKAKDQKNAIA